MKHKNKTIITKTYDLAAGKPTSSDVGLKQS